MLSRKAADCRWDVGSYEDVATLALQHPRPYKASNKTRIGDDAPNYGDAPDKYGRARWRGNGLCQSYSRAGPGALAWNRSGAGKRVAVRRIAAAGRPTNSSRQRQSLRFPKIQCRARATRSPPQSWAHSWAFIWSLLQREPVGPSHEFACCWHAPRPG